VLWVDESFSTTKSITMFMNFRRCGSDTPFSFVPHDRQTTSTHENNPQHPHHISKNSTLQNTPSLSRQQNLLQTRPYIYQSLPAIQKLFSYVYFTNVWAPEIHVTKALTTILLGNTNLFYHFTSSAFLFDDEPQRPFSRLAWHGSFPLCRTALRARELR